MAVCLQGNKGNITRHDPPLLFDLATDVAEEFALDTSQPQYASIVAEITKTLAEQMHSVNNTFVRAPLDFPRRSCARSRRLAVSLTRGVVVQSSVVDYSTQVDSEPCVHVPVSCRSDGPAPPPVSQPPESAGLQHG